MEAEKPRIEQLVENINNNTLKVKYNKPSPAQNAWITKLNHRGYKAVVTWSLDEAIDTVSAQPQFPNQDQLSTGITVVFGLKYKRVAGNPYSQTN